jgi:phospholipid/cholesterol/gamma-HCH transport system substrate-binding protein
MSKAIRDHLRDFIAIAVVVVLGVGVTLAILSYQQAALPSWVPFLGKDRFELKAEFGTAQAVTPGQGQSVNIAGIKVGDVTGVDLENGHAVVTMAIDREFAPLIHRDATMLLRPRTGLQDITVEVSPGTKGKPIAEGTTIPLSQTQPNVQPDQILASLDADTRAYLQLLLQGGAEGFGGETKGRKLGAALKRFEPLARDLSRINGRLAKRRRLIARSIHNFGLVSEELGRRDTKLAEFVDSQDAVLGAFANQEAAIRASLQELPSTLTETRAALASGAKLSQQLGPASRALIPSAQALAPALRQFQPFLADTKGPIEHQIRPFSRQVQPTVRDLSKASQALGQATPKLTGALAQVNKLFNGLAYNPPGSEEGYLFWASWLSHDTNAVFLTEDAGGPLRRGIVLQSCATAQLAEAVAAGQPFLLTLQQLTNVPSSTQICAL